MIAEPSSNVPLISRREAWKPTYEVCRKLSEGPRQIIASYFTLEEAESRARALHEYSKEQYHVYDLLTLKFVASTESKGKTQDEPSRGDTSKETRVPLDSDADITLARQVARALAVRLHFPPSDVTLIAAAISELARNIVCYAKRGQIILRVASRNGDSGIVAVARDEGPGILNITQAMEAGFSTLGGLGLGLRGVKRLMDEFEITSEVGRGTTVSVKKWNLVGTASESPRFPK
jgi:serine/threonine-protein kinase RsbT